MRLQPPLEASSPAAGENVGFLSEEITPGNVCAVQWRLFSTVEAVQYGGGPAAVLWGFSISTVEVAKYGGGLTSAQWRHSIEYSGGCSVRWRANISTVEG